MADPVLRGEEDTLVALTEHSPEIYRFSCSYRAHNWHQRLQTRERDAAGCVMPYRGGVAAENRTATVPARA
jgi:hypothetical protein